MDSEPSDPDPRAQMHVYTSLFYFSFNFMFSFSYLLSNSSFKLKPLLTSSIHQQLQHVSNYITLFIYYYFFE
jgi:hypothetical protein